MQKGFSLTEVLIALALVGTIAAFAIPKVLETHNNKTYTNRTRATVSAISNAYTEHKRDYGVDINTNIEQLIPYLDYIERNTTDLMDKGYDETTGATFSCSGADFYCLELRNGAVVWWWTTHNFSGTALTNAIRFNIDPDPSNYSTSETGPGKSIAMFLYYNGRIKERSDILPHTYSNSYTWWPRSDKTPPWWEGF